MNASTIIDTIKKHVSKIFIAFSPALPSRKAPQELLHLLHLRATELNPTRYINFANGNSQSLLRSNLTVIRHQ